MYNNDTYIVINIYSPPSGDFIEVTGDFNAKHELSGKQKSDHRGTVLLDTMAKFHLYLLNDSSNLPTYFSTHGISWIDLVLLNKTVDARKIIKFTINEDIQLSDHRLLTFDVMFEKVNQDYTERMDLNRIDKWKFSLDVCRIISGVEDITVDSLEDKIGSFVRV